MTTPFSDYIVYVDESGDHSLESINSEGMQIADLTARPIGLSVLRPDQKNRAMSRYGCTGRKILPWRSRQKRRSGIESLPLESRRASG